MRIQNKQESIDEQIAELQKKKEKMQPQQQPLVNPIKVNLEDLGTLPKIGVIAGILGFLGGGIALLILLILLLVG